MKETPEEKETYTPNWEFFIGSIDSKFRMLVVPKDKYKEVTINLTPQIRKEGDKEFRGFNYPIAKIDLHDGTFGSASKVFDDAILLANQISKRWNEFNLLAAELRRLREALRAIVNLDFYTDDQDIGDDRIEDFIKMELDINKSYKGDCVELMKYLPDESVDVILTDPPYLYLKNQKLDRPFDEVAYFDEAKRILKKGGFIILFGRGTSFYRWNTTLADLGFTFKEEIIWDKSYCSSPLMAISRVHETISIHAKGKGIINKAKVPYLEMKGHDIPSICQDIKRIRSALKNTKSLNAVLSFLENNDIPNDGTRKNLSTTISSIIASKDRSASAMKCIIDGMSEKSIIRSDREICEKFTKFGVTSDKRKAGDRGANAMQSVVYGMNEKSIIREGREHYKAILPTQKPPRLLERLLALVCKIEEGKPKPLVLDTFRGSASTDIACMNFGCDYISFEIDDEHFEKGEARKSEHKDNMANQPGCKLFEMDK